MRQTWPAQSYFNLSDPMLDARVFEHSVVFRILFFLFTLTKLSCDMAVSSLPLLYRLSSIALWQTLTLDYWFPVGDMFAHHRLEQAR